MSIFKIMVGEDVLVGETPAESIEVAAKKLGCKLQPDDSLPEGVYGLVFLRSWATLSGNLTIREVCPCLSAPHDLWNVLSSIGELVKVVK